MRGGRGKSERNPYGINQIRAQLGLRDAQEESCHKPYEISTLHTELGLRDIPGKLAQWRRQTERFRLWLAPITLVHPPDCEVLGVLLAPLRLLFPAARRLTLRLAAGPLMRHAYVG